MAAWSDEQGRESEFENSGKFLDQPTRATPRRDPRLDVPPNTIPVFCGFFQNRRSSVAVSMPWGNTFFVCVLMILSYSKPFLSSVCARLSWDIK